MLDIGIDILSWLIDFLIAGFVATVAAVLLVYAAVSIYNSVNEAKALRRYNAMRLDRHKNIGQWEHEEWERLLDEIGEEEDDA